MTLPKTEPDRRKHDRKKFSVDRGGVSFFVEMAGERCAIETVHDVSISGIRLGLTKKVEPGVVLRLTAKEEEFVIAVNGDVRWCRESREFNGFEAGVEFDVTDADNNILFFMSLRKYLDSFDDVPLSEA